LQIDQPDVFLLDWKIAEDGRGTILRFLEVAGQDATASVTLPRAALKSANLCNAVEDDLQPLELSDHAFRLRFRAHEIVTVRLQ
jgi:alpha-mannosidase